MAFPQGTLAFVLDAFLLPAAAAFLYGVVINALVAIPPSRSKAL